MNHLEFAASESAALEPSACEQWFSRLEKLLGHNLDGDQERDGYSLDHCVEMFEQGKRPLDAFHIITWRKRGLHKNDGAMPRDFSEADDKQFVFWTKRQLLLRVLGARRGREGERRYTVCKAECPNPRMGQFSVRQSDTVPA